MIISDFAGYKILCRRLCDGTECCKWQSVLVVTIHWGFALCFQRFHIFVFITIVFDELHHHLWNWMEFTPFFFAYKSTFFQFFFSIIFFCKPTRGTPEISTSHKFFAEDLRNFSLFQAFLPTYKRNPWVTNILKITSST